MGDKTTATADRVRTVLSYDPMTGEFTWQVRTALATKIGATAGFYHLDGYRCIRLDTRTYMAHRLAWVHVHGEWPDGEVDHINGVRDDNRLVNLRVLTRAENGQNMHSAHRDSTSKLLGAYRWKNKWQSSVTSGAYTRHLGTFNTAQEAHEAYIAAKTEMHPPFASAVRLMAQDDGTAA